MPAVGENDGGLMAGVGGRGLNMRGSSLAARAAMLHRTRSGSVGERGYGFRVERRSRGRDT